MPTDESWSSAGCMGQARWEHTATLLSTKKVLIAGSVPSVWLSSAELFDPSAASGSKLVDACPTDPPTQSGHATLSPMASPTVAIPSALSTAAVTQRSVHPVGEPIRITGIPVLGSLSISRLTAGGIIGALVLLALAAGVYIWGRWRRRGI